MFFAPRSRRCGWTRARRRSAARSRRRSAAPRRRRALTGSPRLRALHRAADPQVLPAAAGRLRSDRAHSSRQLVPGVAAARRRRADRSRRRLRHEPDGPRAQSLVARSAGRHRAGLAGEQLPPIRAVVGDRRPARAVLAAALRAAARRAIVDVDRRQPVAASSAPASFTTASSRSRSARATRCSRCTPRAGGAGRRTCFGRRPATS